MKSAKLLGCAALALGLLAPGAANAQVLLPTNYLLPPLEGKAPSGAEKPSRFQIGVGIAIWDFPNDLFEPDIGPLVTVDYMVTDNISIGGWYNHISGDFGPFNGKTTGFDADTWDAHVAYHLPTANRWTRGVSAQVGYSHTKVDIDTGIQSNDDSAVNFWLNKNQHLTYLSKKDRKYPVSIFAGIGYYVPIDSEFGDDGNLYKGGSIVAGGSIGITKNISITGSVWWLGLFAGGDGDTVTRGSVGLVGTF